MWVFPSDAFTATFPGVGIPGAAAYAASKAALIGFTKSIARELGSRGITCNALAPGFIDTDMTSGLNEQSRVTDLRVMKGDADLVGDRAHGLQHHGANVAKVTGTSLRGMAVT